MMSSTKPSTIERYVAIGDSQTEGLNDFAEDGSPRGWADRFAARLAANHTGLLYANLAVRGKRTSEIRRDQVEPALALAPDLVSVVSGVNDVIRPSVDVSEVARDIESMYGVFAAAGCTVMGCTFPLPSAGLTRHAAPRLRALNAALRTAAERHGVLLVELEGVAMAADLRLWSADRIHLNSDGHHRLAAAFAATFTNDGDRTWMEPLPARPSATLIQRVTSETAWIARFLVPKIARMARGQSSGDGRSAKRPELGEI